MTNTVLCGSVSYKHTVKENEDNTELEISTAIHSDMNGTEKNFNFPMKEFVLNSAEVTIEENIGEVLEKFLRLSPENKKEIRELAEKAFDNSKYKNVYKNLPNIENSEQARKLGIDAIYDEVIKELANRRFEKIIKNSPDCIDDIQKLLNSDNPADKTANRIISTIKKYDYDTYEKDDKEIIKIFNSKSFKNRMKDVWELDTEIKRLFGPDKKPIEFIKKFKVEFAQNMKFDIKTLNGKGSLLFLGIGVVIDTTIEKKPLPAAIISNLFSNAIASVPLTAAIIVSRLGFNPTETIEIEEKRVA